MVTYPGYAVGFVAEVSLSLWLLYVGLRAQASAVAPASAEALTHSAR